MLTLRTAAVAAAIVAATITSGACSKDKGGKGDDPPTGAKSDAAPAAATPADAAPTAKITADAAAEPNGATDAAAAAGTEPIDAAAKDPTPAKEKKLTNIKVLSKSWDYDKVEKYMKTFERALGQKCEYCHVEDDHASDDKKEKKITRDMITMQNALNRKYFKGQSKITCYTCHLGKKEPK